MNLVPYAVLGLGNAALNCIAATVDTAIALS